MKIPSLILKQLYNFGSLKNLDDGVQLSLKNRLSETSLVGVTQVVIDGNEPPLDRVTLHIDGRSLAASEISSASPLSFGLGQTVELRAPIPALDEGRHEVVLGFETENFGKLKLKVRDGLSAEEERVHVPYDKEHDYQETMIKKRQDFIASFSGAKLDHITHYSFDPEVTRGNIENFTGVAQVPLGFAGPLHVDGEHAQGEFLIPLATAEGTLVASYNRGIKVINLSGGVKCTVVDDAMQRAPVFVFDSAREARAKLAYIDIYMAGKFAYLRFNFATGDAAGQNMVGRATFAACSWILEHVDNVRRFYLESNLATDKKASQVNVMHTRGKRVIAEVTVPRGVLEQNMRVRPESLAYHYQIANVGAILSGANNNGLHSANAITAMFIATGQDVANVSESSAGIFYCEMTADGGLHVSITIPSLIVATYGGGTGLPTQRECLEILGCVGKGKVRKFAEIVAGVVLAGEISLGSAISSLDWVSSHEEYGRNR